MSPDAFSSALISAGLTEELVFLSFSIRKSTPCSLMLSLRREYCLGTRCSSDRVRYYTLYKIKVSVIFRERESAVYLLSYTEYLVYIVQLHLSILKTSYIVCARALSVVHRWQYIWPSYNLRERESYLYISLYDEERSVLSSLVHIHNNLYSILIHSRFYVDAPYTALLKGVNSLTRSLCSVRVLKLDAWPYFKSHVLHPRLMWGDTYISSQSLSLLCSFV